MGSGALFGLAFGAAVGLAAIPGALVVRHAISPDLALVIVFFALGAAPAGFLAALIAGRLPSRFTRGRRFAAALLSMMLFTTGAHVILLFAEYAAYYAQWWPSDAGEWLQAAGFTFGATGFYYAVLGLPVLLPFGLPVVLAFAMFLARR